MTVEQFIKELHLDIEKLNIIKSSQIIDREYLIDMFYSITRILWWTVENNILNLNNEYEKEYFFKFVLFIIDFHDIIGFDEDEEYADDKYELPFEILYNIIDWFDDRFDDHKDYMKYYEQFKSIMLNHFDKNNCLIRHMEKIEQTWI